MKLLVLLAFAALAAVGFGQSQPAFFDSVPQLRGAKDLVGMTPTQTVMQYKNASARAEPLVDLPRLSQAAARPLVDLSSRPNQATAKPTREPALAPLIFGLAALLVALFRTRRKATLINTNPAHLAR